MFSRRVLPLLFVLCSALAVAQDVYEKQGKEGPDFSDHPIPGGKPVELAPINTYATPPALLPMPPEKPQVTAPVPYESLVISVPENEGSVYTNTGDFDVQWQAVPPLDLQRGDAIIVKLDGSPLQQSFTAAPLHISASDWQRAFGESVEHRLQLLIINQEGAVLIESAPVKFYMHHATAR